MDDIIKDFRFTTDIPKIIKVIGVGGGGCNAVSHMYRQGIDGVSFMVCNTDMKSVGDSPVPDKLLLGEGLGAGNDPEEGRRKAESCEDRIRQHGLAGPAATGDDGESPRDPHARDRFPGGHIHGHLEGVVAVERYCIGHGGEAVVPAGQDHPENLNGIRRFI